MGSPKLWWGYQPRLLKGSVATEDIVSFEVLDNLVTLVNQFGKGKEAAQTLKDIVLED